MKRNGLLKFILIIVLICSIGSFLKYIPAGILFLVIFVLLITRSVRNRKERERQEQERQEQERMEREREEQERREWERREQERMEQERQQQERTRTGTRYGWDQTESADQGSRNTSGGYRYQDAARAYFITCEYCGSLVDPTKHSCCDHCGAPFGDNEEWREILNRNRHPGTN